MGLFKKLPRKEELCQDRLPPPYLVASKCLEPYL